MVEKIKDNNTQNKEKGEVLTPIHIIPSSVTLLNGISGLFSIYFSFNGLYFLAILFIFVGFFADTFDGPIARRLNATSKFGAELDSMCDIISFGVAPFMLLLAINPFYVVIAFGYVTCAIIRLARFGAIPSPPYRHLGLASPMAAIWVAASVGISTYFPPTWVIVFIFIITIASTILMVCPREYHKILAASTYRNRVMDWIFWLSTGFILILWPLFNYEFIFIFIVWLVSITYVVFLGAPFLKWNEE